jgi:hypothetical protein
MKNVYTFGEGKVGVACFTEKENKTRLLKIGKLAKQFEVGTDLKKEEGVESTENILFVFSNIEGITTFKKVVDEIYRQFQEEEFEKL